MITGEIRETEFTAAKYNLLNIPFLKKLFLWKGFPFIIQIPILIVLTSLIVSGWGLYAPKGTDTELFGNTNIVCLLIWGIWWPLMIISVVLLGRIWCSICPLELVSRISEKIGQVFHVKQAGLNKTLRNGAVLLALYFLIHLLIEGTDADEVPAYTAFLLTGIITLSIFTGFFFKNGALCKAFCPISLTLNAYSRRSMLAVRPESEAECVECRDKNCVGVCPSNIYPPYLKSSQDCLLCGKCLKSCKSGNVQLLLRLPFNKSDIREKTASWILTLFIMMDSGFVCGELAEQWQISNNIFFKLPQLFAAYFGLQVYSNWIEITWSMLIFPLILWTIWGLIMKLLSKPSGTLTTIWRNYAFRIVVISSSGHILRSLMKIWDLNLFH